MERDEILKGLREVMATVKPKVMAERIVPEAILSDDLGIDSFSMLLLSLAAEQKFGIAFDPGKPFVSVSDIMEYIITRKGAVDDRG
jgi:acyl carrier protein